MAGTIMRSTQFRAVVEPILNQSFDGVYDQRTDEYKQIFSEENGIKRAYHEEPVLYGFGAAPKLPDGQPVVYDEGGQLLTGSYMDYAMPRASDIPKLSIGNVVTPCTHNPLGVKGCGEAGAIGSPPAYINAITDALGVKDIAMPATVERVWRAANNVA